MCEGEGAGGAQRMTGSVTHLRVRGEVSLGVSALYIIQRGTLVAWRGVCVLNGCTCER